MKRRTTKNKVRKGFTLIELLIVVGVVGVLVGGIIMVFNPMAQIQKSQDAKRKSDLGAIQKSLELYYQDNGRYPASSVDFRIIDNSTTIAWGAAWNPYMARVPADPTTSKRYVYFTPATANGQTYYLYASLDRGAQDVNACNSGNPCSTVVGTGFPGANACGGACNFGMSSPNVSP